MEMKEHNQKLPLNIQMFAEGDPNQADPSAGNDGNKDKSLTQTELNRISGNAREEGRLAILKELGIDTNDVPNAKEAIKTYQEQQKANQTEIDRLKEENTTYKSQIESLTSYKKETILKDKIGEVLKDKDIEVDLSHSNTVFKLLKGEGDISEFYKDDDVDTDTLKERVQNILKNDLNMLNANDTKDKKQVGRSIEKNPQYTSAQRQELDNKYKGNPFYKPGNKK